MIAISDAYQGMGAQTPTIFCPNMVHIKLVYKLAKVLNVAPEQQQKEKFIYLLLKFVTPRLSQIKDIMKIGPARVHAPTKIISCASLTETKMS